MATCSQHKYLSIKHNNYRKKKQDFITQFITSYRKCQFKETGYFLRDSKLLFRTRCYPLISLKPVFN